MTPTTLAHLSPILKAFSSIAFTSKKNTSLTGVGIWCFLPSLTMLPLIASISVLLPLSISCNIEHLGFLPEVLNVSRVLSKGLIGPSGLSKFIPLALISHNAWQPCCYWGKSHNKCHCYYIAEDKGQSSQVDVLHSGIRWGDAFHHKQGQSNVAQTWEREAKCKRILQILSLLSIYDQSLSLSAKSFLSCSVVGLITNSQYSSPSGSAFT